MSVIEASAGTFRTRADGSCVLSVEIDPAHAKRAFALFGTVGTPVALAALKTGHAAKSDAPKGATLAKEAALLSQNAEFMRWVGAGNDEEAAQWIRGECSVQSRAELDSDQQAAARFIQRVRLPFMRRQS